MAAGSMAGAGMGGGRNRGPSNDLDDEIPF